MTENQVDAVFLLLFLTTGALLVRNPVSMLRYTLRQEHWRRIEASDQLSTVVTMTRFIGIVFLIFVLLILLSIATHT